MPDEALIRKRAFEIFEYRQEYGMEGTAAGDWLLAEEEFKRAKRPYIYTPEDEQ